MSEPIPESIPTSQDPRSKRPLKRRALTPTTQQASQVSALFAKADRDIVIPSSTTLTKKSAFPAPPEIVANVQGSSAGAGSGEFHVYKASRRREYERIKFMEEEVDREKADEEFVRKRDDMRRRDEEKTNKNKRRREKAKAKKGKGVKEDGNDQLIVSGDSDRGGDGNVSMVSPASKQDNVGGGREVPAGEIGVTIHDDD